MTKRTRRGRSPAFKAKVALAAVKGEKTLCRVGAAVRRSPEPDYDLRGQLPKGAAAVFGSESHSERAEAAIDVKTLHVKIGELTLVSNFCLGRSSRRDCCRAQNDDRTLAHLASGTATQEEVYLRAYGSVSEARTAIGR
jgi:transposase